ncbi:alanine acetyltransferase [Planococcus sp. PAMC 21323]|uniref:GNAT family N-acetyltransferase n=1 Tax=Planococcus sp. PAMC 21323 TaxID=1526927 RepID=UPI00056DC703|nr:GNAT family N-acetyltransferase [Planococcus sp. PAMC 21323]AIY06511.1 alanine acetyltransferase [Planococcus sp. PAMC 21323]
MISKLNHQDEQIAKKIYQIQQAAYRIEAELMGFNDIPQLHETVQELQKSKELFIGYSQEQLQGVISYQVEEETVDIHRLVVDPIYFRQGIGKKLVSYLLKKYRGYKFTVSTGTANKPAIGLYKMFGFQESNLIQVAPNIYCTQFYLNN